MCQDIPFYAVAVPTGTRGIKGSYQAVYVCGPDVIGELLQTLDRDITRTLDGAPCLSASSYWPLPTLVRAARELFETGSLRLVRKAIAQTDPACAVIAALIPELPETPAPWLQSLGPAARHSKCHSRDRRTKTHHKHPDTRCTLPQMPPVSGYSSVKIASHQSR